MSMLSSDMHAKRNITIQRQMNSYGSRKKVYTICLFANKIDTRAKYETMNVTHDGTNAETSDKPNRWFGCE